MSQKGLVDDAFDLGAGPNNTIYKVAQSSDGGYWVGGLFNRVGETIVNHIAKLNSDGSLDESFHSTAVDGTVFDVLEVEEGCWLAVTSVWHVERRRVNNEAFQSPNWMVPCMRFQLRRDAELSSPVDSLP